MSRSRLAGVATMLTVLASVPGAAPAAECPSDGYTLWSNGLLRGANVFQGRNPMGASNGIGDGDFVQADFDDLARAGANYVHLSHAGVFGEASPYDADPVAEANLDRMLDLADRAGLFAGIAFRSGPGRNENAISNRDGPVLETIWTDAAAQDAWAAMIAHVAERYRDRPHLVALSIMVEPNAYARHGFIDPPDFNAIYRGSLEDVNVLYAKATAAVRAVNAAIPILLEPEGYGNVDWLPFVTVTGDDRTVYTAHDYTPFDYTHEQKPGATYPGNYDLDGAPPLEHVDATYLASYLQTLQDYVDLHGVPVALTEFGVHRKAANAAGYLTDRIGIQNGLGSWAVWTWQPLGFEDPFNAHDPSAVHDALVAAWAANCTRGGAGGTRGGIIRGVTAKLRKNGTGGKPIPKVTVSTDGASATTKRKPRRIRGAYELRVAAGTHAITASAGRAICHVGTPTGPPTLTITLASDEVREVDVYCAKR